MNTDEVKYTPEVMDALQNARAELLKLKSTQPKEILDNSIIFADRVLKQLCAYTLGLEVEGLFPDCLEETTMLQITDGKNNKDYTLSLQLVDSDYVLDLMDLTTESVKERMVFLLNTVKVLYCSVRDYIQEQGIKFDYQLHIDDNTNLYLDEKSDKKIGIILTRLN